MGILLTNLSQPSQETLILSIYILVWSKVCWKQVTLGVDFGSDVCLKDYLQISTMHRPLLEKAVKRFFEVGDVLKILRNAQDNQSHG